MPVATPEGLRYPVCTSGQPPVTTRKDTPVQDQHHDSAAAEASTTRTTGGTEWVIDARGCRAETLRSPALLQSLFTDVCLDLALVPVAEAQWHVFPGHAGVTGLQMLSESHLTCHTFPEIGYAALNLYCCSPKPRWAWEPELRTRLGATDVCVRMIARG